MLTIASRHFFCGRPIYSSGYTPPTFSHHHRQLRERKPPHLPTPWLDYLVPRASRPDPLSAPVPGNPSSERDLAGPYSYCQPPWDPPRGAWGPHERDAEGVRTGRETCPHESLQETDGYVSISRRQRYVHPHAQPRQKNPMEHVAEPTPAGQGQTGNAEGANLN